MEAWQKMNEINNQKVRHAHCSFCGGKGPDLKAELVISQTTGAHYRAPLSHTSCKDPILSLSLSMKGSQQMKISLHEKAQGLVEYALIIALMAVVVVAVLLVLGPAIGNVFSKIISGLTQ